MRGMGLAGVICACLAVSIYAETAITLVRDGVPTSVVVLSAKPTRPARVAAQELIHYVAKMTGAKLPLALANAIPKAHRDLNRVLIGESQLTKALGLKNSDFQEQEYLIEMRGRTLILMGRDAEEFGEISYEKNGLWPGLGHNQAYFLPMGSLYAVHTFLEAQCGVRWYLPGEIGEVCPKSDRLEVSDVRIRTRPWTRYRWSSRQAYREPFHFYGYARPDKLVRVPTRDMTLWMLRMKIGGGRYACNHSLTSYQNRFAEEHPEWWKEGKPTRAFPHPDYANPDLIKQVCQDALDYFDGRFPKGTYPDGSRIMGSGDYFAAMPLDGRKNLIWSDAAEKMRNRDPDVQSGFSCGWASDFVFNMVNQVARAVGQKHPDKWVTCCAYGPYFHPPRKLGKLEPNISIQRAGFLCTAFRTERYRKHQDNLRAWSELTRELYVWEYYLTQAFSRFRAFPVIHPRKIAAAIKFMQSVGLKGMFFEASAAPAKFGPYTDAHLANPAEDLLNIYVTWKWLCDASQDVDAMLDEHFQLFYGPAEEPMRAFFELIAGRWSASDAPGRKQPGHSKYWDVMCNQEVLESARLLIRQALESVTAEPYQSRVRLMYLAIYERMERNSYAHQSRFLPRRRLLCPLVSRAIKIDGVMEETWKAVPVSPSFVSSNGLPCDVKTTARAARDGKHLYLYVECEEPSMDRTTASTQKPPEKAEEEEGLEEEDGPDDEGGAELLGELEGDKGCARTRQAARAIFEDDHVEIRLDRGRERVGSYCMVVNTLGASLSRHVDHTGKETSWDSGATVAVSKQPRGWAVEVQVPIERFRLAPVIGGKGTAGIPPGEVWGLQVSRFRPSVGIYEPEPRWTSLSPTFGSDEEPSTFAVLDTTGGRRVPDTASGPEANKILPKPVIHYDFEGFMESGKVEDRAGVQVGGKRHRSTAWLTKDKGGEAWGGGNAVEGVRGGGILFRGPKALQYLRIDLAGPVNVTADDFTLAFWLKTPVPSGVLFNAGNTSSAPVWRMSFASRDGKRFPALSFAGRGQATSVVYCPSARVADTEWHHYVVIFDRGGVLRIYVDKKLVGMKSMAGHRGTLKKRLEIGGPYWYLNGALDEFMLFQGTPGREQLERLYDETRGDAK